MYKIKEEMCRCILGLRFFHIEHYLKLGKSINLHNKLSGGRMKQ